MWRRKTTDPPPGQKPTAEDFSPSAVRRAVKRWCRRHPLTVYPVVFAVITAVLTGASHVLGDGNVGAGAFFTTVGAALFGAGHFVWSYYFRGGEHAKRYLALKQAELELHEASELEDLEESLQREGFDGALPMLEAYATLRAFLKDKMGGRERNPTAVRFLELAEAAFREAQPKLRAALSITEGLRQVGIEGLEEDKRKWERDRSRTRGDTSALQRRIDAVQSQIEAYRERERQRDQILAEVAELETLFTNTYLEGLDLVSRDAGEAFLTGDAAKRLEHYVSATRQIDDDLRGVKSPERERDEQQMLDAARAAEQRERTNNPNNPNNPKIERKLQ